MNTIHSPRAHFTLKPLCAALLIGMAGGSVHADDLAIDAALHTTQTATDSDYSVGSDDATHTVTIDQNTRVLELNWDRLNVQGDTDQTAQETLRFQVGAQAQFEGADMISINNILGDSPSQIMGRIESPGSVFIINPRGIVFGQDAVINVRALVASTLELENVELDELGSDTFQFSEFENQGGDPSVLRYLVKNPKTGKTDLVLIAPHIELADDLTFGTGSRFQIINANQAVVNVQDGSLTASATVPDGESLENIELTVADREIEQLTLTLQQSGNGSFSVLNTEGQPTGAALSVSNGQVKVVLSDDPASGLADPAGGVSVDQVLVEAVPSADPTADLPQLSTELMAQGQDDLSVTAGGQASVQFSEVGNASVTAEQIVLGQEGGDSFHVTGELKAIATAPASQDADGSPLVSISQVSSVRVDGESELQGNRIVLAETGNDFSELVTVTSTGDTSSATLHDQNTADVHAINTDTIRVTAIDEVQTSFSNVGTATLSSERVILGRAAPEEQPATSSSVVELNVTSDEDKSIVVNSVNQAGSLAVSQATNLDANTVTLTTKGNDFTDLVTVTNIGENGAIAIENNANLSVLIQAQTGELDQSVQSIDLVAGGTLDAEVTLADAGDLSVHGKLATSLDWAKAQSVEVSGSSVALGLAGKQAALEVINALGVKPAQGSSAVIGSVTQNRALEVGGTTTLTGNAITLENSANNFTGLVTVTSTGADSTATLHDQNKIDVHAVNTDTLALTAIEEAQASFANVGKATISSEAVILGRAAAAGQPGAVSSLSELNVESDSSKSIAVNAIEQEGALEIDQTTNLEATTIALDNSGNDFSGLVAVTSTGENGTIAIQDASDLNVVVQAQAGDADQAVLKTNLKAAGSLSAEVIIADAGELIAHGTGLTSLDWSKAESVDATGSSVALGLAGKQAAMEVVNALTVTSEAGSTIDQITQNRALEVGGETTLGANTITLNNPANHFVGSVLVSTSSENGNLNIVDSANLAVTVQPSNTGGAFQRIDLLAEGNLNADVNANVTELLVANAKGSNFFSWQTAPTVTASGSRVVLGEQGQLSFVTDLLEVTPQTGGAAQIDSIEQAGLLQVGLPGQNARTLLKADQILLKGNDNSSFEYDADGEFKWEETLPSQGYGNAFYGTVSVDAGRMSLSSDGALNFARFSESDGVALRVADQAVVKSMGAIRLEDLIRLGSGQSAFVSHAAASVSPDGVTPLIRPSGSVLFQNDGLREPLSLLPVAFAQAHIVQESGELVTETGGMLTVVSTGKGSIALNQDNKIDGLLQALSGELDAPYEYNTNQGLGLVSVFNTTGLTLGGTGVEGDMVILSAPGLGTAEGARLRARLPYDDRLLGVNQSLPGLVLSVDPLFIDSDLDRLGEKEKLFLEQPGSRFQDIQVVIGGGSEGAGAGYATVLPFEGANLDDGVVVFLEGPDRDATYAFFYDGAGQIGRVPVVYNGVLPLTTAARTALSQVSSLTPLASVRQREGVVRTENVNSRLRSGVVFEAGPGRPATSGSGGLRLPQIAPFGNQLSPLEEEE